MQGKSYITSKEAAEIAMQTTLNLIVKLVYKKLRAVKKP